MSDTQERQRPAAQAGMQRIPFSLETYPHPSLPLSDKRLINLMAEKAPVDARAPGALVPTGGMFSNRSAGSGPVLALAALGSAIGYAVSGDHFYRLHAFPSFYAEDLGVVGTMTGNRFPTIACGTVSTVVCVPPRAYTCGNNPGEPLNEIAGGGFPVDGAGSVEHIDGYFVFTDYGSTPRFFISEILDPLAYDALDFASADAVPNVLRRTVAHRGQLWLIGESGIEIWYNSGNADFPFRRVPGGFIGIGCATARSVTRLDNSVWWMGRNGVIYRSRNYEAERVSTHALERYVHRYGPEEADHALGFVADGHSLYCFTIGERTFCYDVVTQAWHERSSSTDGSLPWRPFCSMLWSGSFYMGDSRSGRLMQVGPDYSTEVGDSIMRRAHMPPLWAGTSRAFCARLEVEMEVGTALAAGNLVVEWSDDGGYTWTGSRTLSPGAAGAYRHRVYTTRLGSFRQREFRLTTLGAPTIYGVAADIQAGSY